MKKLLLLLIFAATVVLTSPAQTDRKDMSEAAVARLDKAVTLMDNGMAETALEILENLDKEYPDNYTVLYEMCYAHSVMGNLKRVVELCKRLEKHPAADFQVYHMEGNALDNMGKRKEAIKTYNRGLERFPDAALLYVEQGTIAQNEKDYDKAVEMFEKAIEVQPEQPSAYYNLARLFAMSTEPFWAIMYAEAARLLSMNYDFYLDRSDEMSSLLYDLYKENIHFTTQGDSTIVHTTLTKMNTIEFSQDTSTMVLPLPIAFENGMLFGLAGEKEFTLQSLINARGRFIDELYKALNGYYDVSILDFQRQVRQSGHWQAYNMFLMCEGDSEAYKNWFKTDSTAEAQTDAFAKWYQDHPFLPTVQTPTLRTKTYKTANLGVPSRNDVSSAKDCRKYSADALRLARWWLDEPFDSTSYVQERVQNFLFGWMINSDEIMIELRDCCLADSDVGMIAMIMAMIEYGVEHKVKNLGEEGFKYAVKRAMAYLDKNRTVIDVPERAEQAMKMTPDELDQLLHKEYNIPVETREMIKPR